VKYLIITLVAVLVIGGGMGGCAISYHNQAVDLETQHAQIQVDNTNQYDNMIKKISQSAQVTNAQAKIIADIVVQHAQARGGSGGMTLVNAVKESIPDIPVETFTNLQNIIVGSRDKFASRQTMLLSVEQQHAALRQRFPSSFIVGGRPELDSVIVTSTKTEEAFQTGVDDDIDLKLQ